MRAALAIALMLGIGVAVYCCGPKSAPPPVVAVCPGGLPETCLRDDIGDYDCTCPQE